MDTNLIKYCIIPYLDNIIKGDKTIESRFSKVRCSPFRQVNKGDILIFKESSGGIIALSSIKDVEYYGNMSSEKTIEVLTKYQKELTITPEFMEEKKDSKYASLMYIDKTITISTIKLEKIDRRAWISFEKSNYGKLF